MFKPKLAAILCLSLCLAACQTARNAQVDEPEIITYTDWKARNFGADRGRAVHMAETKATIQKTGKTNTMAAYRSAPNCSSFLVSLEVGGFDKPFPKKVVVKNLKGEIRIDDGKPVEIQYDYTAHEGKTEAFVDMATLLSTPEIRDSLQKGQMVSFRLMVEKTSLTPKFSLRGYANALRTAMNNCQEDAAFQGASPGSQGKGPARPAPQGSSGSSSADEEDKKFFK